MIRRALMAALLVVLVLAAPAALAAEPQASLPDIEDEVMCPICGTTLELSDSPQAERERQLIRRLIASGETKSEIEDVLVAQYGSDVLAEPEGSGFDLTAWVVPIVGLLVAAGAIGGFLLGRARRRPSEPDRAPLEGAEQARLAEDMSRYDL